MASVFWGLLTVSNLAALCEQPTLLCPCVWLQVLGEGTDIPVSLEGPGTQTAGGCPDSQGREGPPPPSEVSSALPLARRPHLAAFQSGPAGCSPAWSLSTAEAQPAWSRGGCWGHRASERGLGPLRPEGVKGGAAGPGVTQSLCCSLTRR